MHCRVKRSAGVNGAGYIECHHLFPQRVPPLASKRRRQRFAPSGNVRVDVATDKAEFFDAALQLVHPFFRADSGRLWQLADGRYLLGPAARHTGDQIITGPGPVAAYKRGAKMVPHRRCLRGEHQAIDPRFRHAFELSLHRSFQLFIAELQFCFCWSCQIGDLAPAVCLQLWWGGREMGMSIDDHRSFLLRRRSAASIAQT